MAATVDATIKDRQPQVVLKIESTEGADSSPVVATDDIWFEEFSWDLQQDPLKRRGTSNRRAGVIQGAGAMHFIWSGTTDIQMETIASGADNTNAPTCGPLLRCCGFSEITSDATDDSLTYQLVDDNGESATIKVFDINADNSSQNRATLLGSRGNLVISYEWGQLLQLAASGFAIPNATMASNLTVTDAASSGSVFSADKPMVAKGGVDKIVDLSDDSLYGGGTIGTPTNTVQVISLSIDCMNNPVEHGGTAAGAGIARIRHNPDTPVASLVVEQTNFDDWSPYVSRAATQTFECNFTFATPGTSGDTVQIVFYGQIVGDITQGESDGRKTWEFSMELLYPEDPSDGAPSVGTSAAQTMDAGTNKGLGIDTATTTIASSLTLQFRSQ